LVNLAAAILLPTIITFEGDDIMLKFQAAMIVKPSPRAAQ